MKKPAKLTLDQLWNKAIQHFKDGDLKEWKKTVDLIHQRTKEKK